MTFVCSMRCRNCPDYCKTKDRCKREKTSGWDYEKQGEEHDER